MEELIVFLHIPRTGGMNLGDMLKTLYGDRHQRIAPRGLISSGLSDGIQIISGHLCWGVHKLIRRPCRYFTILRHPVDRVVSEMFFTRNFSLDDFSFLYRSGKKHKHDNIATNLLAGTTNREHLLTFEGIAENCLDFDVAKAHLSQCEFVGIFDDYGLCIERLFKHFGWETLPFGNIGPARRPPLSDIPLDVVQYIEKIEWADMQLYQEAKEKWS